MLKLHASVSRQRRTLTCNCQKGICTPDIELMVLGLRLNYLYMPPSAASMVTTSYIIRTVIAQHQNVMISHVSICTVQQ